MPRIKDLFKCPNCGSSGIEEVMANVTVTSEVVAIEGDEPEYGEQTNEDGDVERYQCSECGWLIPARDGEELARYLGIDLDAEDEEE